MNDDKLLSDFFSNFNKPGFSDYYSLCYLKVASELKKKGVKVREFEAMEFVAG